MNHNSLYIDFPRLSFQPVRGAGGPSGQHVYTTINAEIEHV